MISVEDESVKKKNTYLIHNLKHIVLVHISYFPRNNNIQRSENTLFFCSCILYVIQTKYYFKVLSLELGNFKCEYIRYKHINCNDISLYLYST